MTVEYHVGGAYVMGPNSVPVIGARSTEFDPPRRLVQTFRFAGAGTGESSVQWNLAAAGNYTRIEHVHDAYDLAEGRGRLLSVLKTRTASPLSAD